MAADKLDIIDLLKHLLKSYGFKFEEVKVYQLVPEGTKGAPVRISDSKSFLEYNWCTHTIHIKKPRWTNKKGKKISIEELLLYFEIRADKVVVEFGDFGIMPIWPDDKEEDLTEREEEAKMVIEKALQLTYDICKNNL